MPNNKQLFRVITVVILVADATFCLRSRQKRLVFPAGASRIQVICGAGIPVDLKRETVIFGTLIKGNYKLPSNVSQILSPGVFYERKRRRRSITRWNIYGMLAEIAQMYGLGGKSCLLKAICEAARHPLDKNFGLYDELMHLVLTPSSTKEAVNHHTDNEYFAAQMAGQQSERCDLLFPECKRNLMDELTVLQNEIL